MAEIQESGGEIIRLECSIDRKPGRSPVVGVYTTTGLGARLFFLIADDIATNGKPIKRGWYEKYDYDVASSTHYYRKQPF